MKPAHLIAAEPWESLGFYTRITLEASTAMLWPLEIEDRITVLINLLADQIVKVTDSNEQVDAVIDLLRLHLKLTHEER
jgi:hypothetical protein